MIRLTKEDRLAIRVKMDAVNLQGVWTNFPEQPAVATGRLTVAAGIYRRLVEEEIARRRRQREKVPTRAEMRKQLLDEVIERLVVQENNDLVTVVLAI